MIHKIHQHFNAVMTNVPPIEPKKMIEKIQLSDAVAQVENFEDDVAEKKQRAQALTRNNYGEAVVRISCAKSPPVFHVVGRGAGTPVVPAC